MQVGLVVEQLLAPVPGGTGRYTRELGAALVATAPAGSSVSGWTGWHRSLDAARIPGVRGPRRLPLPRRVLAEAWRRGVGPGIAATVVHAPTLLVPPRRPGRRLVVTVHDVVPWTHPETLTARGVAWHQAMGERVAREADLVLTPTAAIAEQVRRRLAPRLVEVVGEGVSPAVAEVPADHAERSARLGLPAAYALVVGTLEPRKGLDVALAAVAEPAWPDLPLVVVGPTGWGGLRLPSTPDGAVRRLGHLSDPDLAVAYAHAAVVLVPSRSEGFGLPLLEGMAHGVPVVASAVPALQEVGGAAALFVPVGHPAALAEAVATALARADELGPAGRRLAASHTWTGAAATCWRLYATLA